MLWIIRSEVPFTILRALSAPWFHLWFVPALFLFCFITTLLRRLPALAVLSVFFLPHLAIWAGFPVEEITGPIDTRYITYGLYFAVGYCWREHSPRLHWSVLLAMLIIGAALAWSLFPLGGKWPDVLSRSLLSGGAIGLVHAFSSVGLGSLSDNLFARESLAIYLYHYLPILLMKSYANLMSSGTYWVVSLFAGLVVVPMAISAARRLPFSELVLGTLPSLQKILRDSSLSGGGPARRKDKVVAPLTMRDVPHAAGTMCRPCIRPLDRLERSRRRRLGGISPLLNAVRPLVTAGRRPPN